MNTEISPHALQLTIEIHGLSRNIIILEEFIQTNPIYKTLDHVDRDLMVQQLNAMQNYQSILRQRIQKAEATPEDSEEGSNGS